MKKVFSLLFALMVCGSAVWADTQGVKLVLKNGKTVEFCFSKHPVLAVSGNELTISVASSTQQLSYAYSDIQQIKFIDGESTGIAVANADCQSVNFTFSSGEISATGLAAGESVSVYTVDGKTSLTAKAKDDGTLSISYSSLPQGVNIIQTQSGISYKFINK